MLVNCSKTVDAHAHAKSEPQNCDYIFFCYMIIQLRACWPTLECVSVPTVVFVCKFIILSSFFMCNVFKYLFRFRLGWSRNFTISFQSTVWKVHSREIKRQFCWESENSGFCIGVRNLVEKWDMTVCETFALYYFLRKPIVSPSSKSTCIIWRKECGFTRFSGTCFSVEIWKFPWGYKNIWSTPRHKN